MGLSAALAFARDGFDTVLVGGLDTRRDGRTVALLNGSVRFLEALGAWPELVKNAAPLETMRIVDDTGSLFRPPPAAFRAGEIGLDAFGWNIENVTLVETLAEAARACANLTLVPAFATGFDTDGTGATPDPCRRHGAQSEPRGRRRRAQFQAAPDRRDRNPDAGPTRNPR